MKALMFVYTNARTIFALAFGITLLILLQRDHPWIRSAWVKPVLLTTPFLLVWAVFYKVWRPANRQSLSFSQRLMPLLALFCIMLVYLFTSGITARRFFFSDWDPAAIPFWSSGLLRFSMLSGFLLIVLMCFRKHFTTLLAIIFLISIGTCLQKSIHTTHGLPLWRDDHPSFIFRLWMFGDTFPQMFNYNPFWNAGAKDYTLIDSGISGVGLLLWPLWSFLPTHQIYTPAIAFIFLLLVPTIALLSLRWMGAGWNAALIAGILALGATRHYLFWLLHYGTLGASLASTMVLPFIACLIRIIVLNRTNLAAAAALVLSTAFLVIWPPGAIMGTIASVGVFVLPDKLSRKKLLVLSLCATSVAILYIYPVSSLLLHSTVMQHVTAGSAPSSADAQIQFFSREVAVRGFRHLLAHFSEVNPVVLFLGLGSVIALPHRTLRRWYIPVIIGFTFLTGWGRDWKPNLQLSRMAIPFFAALIIPASVGAAALLKNRSVLSMPLQACLLALLLLSGINISRIYGTQHRDNYVTLSTPVIELCDWIRNNTSPNGRILFAGPTVHSMGGGHVAYLPVMTGREMVACDYYHFPPQMVQYECPPYPYRNTIDGTFQFIELMNVTHVITADKNWKTFFSAQPDVSTDVHALPLLGKDWACFTIKRIPSFFLQGSGTVHAEFNSLNVELDSSPEEVVIKYRWLDGLRAEAPAELFPYEAGPDITLIGIRPNGTRRIHISF